MKEKIRQFRYDIVRPVLKHLDMWSMEAENLVLGTGYVESRYDFIRQIGGGPALGFWQMEPLTAHDIWKNYIGYRGDLMRKITDMYGDWPENMEEHLISNNYFACAMCRLHYRRFPDKLPADSLGMAKLHKLRYNSYKGATKIEESEPLFKMIIDIN